MVFDDTSAASLEQFTLLAKNARGKACVALIEQALSNKKLFVFRELLDMPNVQALKNTDHDRYFQLLEIFCYGKYSDYLERKNGLPVLSPPQKQKLRKLTTIALASKSKIVPYKTLMVELDVTTIRELEDIVIETIYSGLVQGKLDQKSQSLMVKYAVGRDTQDADIDMMINTLTKWTGKISHVCQEIETILQHADSLEEKEKSRQEVFHTRTARASSERNSRNDNVGSVDPYGPRRNQMPKRLTSGGSVSRKGRF